MNVCVCVCVFSTELMRRVRRFQVAQYSCLVIKYAKDTRYSQTGMNFIWTTLNVLDFFCTLRFQIFKYCPILTNHTSMESLFIQLSAFGNILNLVPLAESVVKLNAVCMQCFKEAAYTKRLGAEQEVRTNISIWTHTRCALLVEVIGGTDKYHAVCRACYGGLVACKENCDPQREETPPHVTSGKQPNQSAPRKLFFVCYKANSQ
uniref:Thymidine kinase n=1 Tax=Sinocyclocheilus anshuiensis TaxID=1608454 RepID=A0A671L906_9TELE